jgi:putative membrane-bound dehydrogenase-like protein
MSRGNQRQTGALWGLLAVAAIAASAVAQDEFIPHRQDRPPNKPYAAQEAARRMTVPPGFAVDVVAAEPDIVNPIAMTFDDRGRIWATESVEYPRKAGGVGRDRVKVLEDTNHDGRADKVTVFAEGLNIPTSVAVGYGGVWILNAPDLLFCRERDGKEISREVVLTGFGRADSHELPSSLTWGPDGWLYGLNGVFNPSTVISKDGKRCDFTCAMWRIHPRTRQFQVFAEGTSNPYGIAWDAEGSAIIEVCHWANDHLFHFAETGYYQRQAGAYPPFTWKVGSITDHGHQKTAYCGIARLDTPFFPAPWRGAFLVGNLHGGCINADRLERDGSTYVAKAEPDLLTANDVWFMPVSLKVGPDGCLYVLDWYDRYHCSQDAARDPEGVDRAKGRLYRVRPADAPPVPTFDLGAESNAQLIGRLGSDNIFFRESAQRLLTERGDAAAALRELVGRSGAPRQQRLHALWALIGSGPLDASLHKALLADADPAVRAWAVRAAGNMGRCAPPVREAFVPLARDPSPDVQLQVAIAARKIEGIDALALLVDVLDHCRHDKLIPAIVWPNLHPLIAGDPGRFAALVGSKKTPASPGLSATLPRAVDRLMAADPFDPRPVAAVLDATTSRAPDRASACVAAVAGRLDSLGAAKARLAEHLRGALERMARDERLAAARFGAQLLAARLGLGGLDAAAVRRLFLDPSQPEPSRLQALDALVALRDPALLDTLPPLLASSRAQFTARMLPALGRLEDPKVADVVLAQYPSLPAETKPLAVDLMMQREPWARKLLDGVLAGKLPRSVLDANQLRRILESNDREAVWAVEKAFGRVREERDPAREKVVNEMTEFLKQASGDPHAGRVVFRNFCGQCHTLYGEGGNVGPDLTGNGRGSFDQLVSSVFDPSLVIGPQYQVTTVVTKDGRNLTGLITENSAERVVVRMPGEGEEAVPRNNVKYTRVSRLSMMPEGIENVLDRKDLGDLFSFLSLDKPPTDPAAKPIPGAPAVTASGGSPRAESRPKDDPMRGEIEQHLRKGLLEVWYPRCLDREHGGFLCDFDWRWEPKGQQPKTIVFQARNTWLAAQAAVRYPDDPRYLQAARHGFNFLRDRQWDGEHGGWYWKLDRAGNVTDQTRGVKHAYGIGFGIYACAEVFRATRDPQALELARGGFEWLERHGHDDKSGGYYEYFARDGSRITDVQSNPLGGDRDAIGTKLGLKSMNTHIHLLEALAALYQVWPESRVARRLNEVFELVRDRITAPPGAMHQFFRPDWTPVPGLDSFGHDVETGYLLMEAAEVLDKADDAGTRAVAKSLVDHTLDYGWDKDRGGVHESGEVRGPVHDKRKVWWAQAEALNAFLTMARLYPDDPRDYRKLFERQWDYCKANCIDAQNGEWYPDALDGGGNPKANKASEWKAGYHTGRAMLNAVEWLK